MTISLLPQQPHSAVVQDCQTPRSIDLESSMAREQQRRIADREQTARSIIAALEEAGGPDALFLYDRRQRGVRFGGDVGPLAVTSRGVWVITARPCDGTRVDVAWAGGVSDTERERLLVGGRDKTLLVKALDAQHTAVRRALAGRDVPVAGLLCFMGAQLSRVWSPSIHGYPVADIDATAALLQTPGPYDSRQRHEIWEYLSRAFPAA